MSDNDYSVPNCPVCRHRSRQGCPNCGGAQGYMSLPPCPACPSGTVIGDEPLVAPGVDGWSMAGSDYFFYRTDGVPNPETMEAIATSNLRRRVAIDAVLAVRPEMIDAVERLLSIQGLGG